MLYDQIDDLTGTTAQKSDVVDAIKSVSETGMAKGFAAGQDDLRQEVDAMRVKTDGLQMHYTPMAKQLQAQSVDLSVLSKDLNSNTRTQRNAIIAQNALTQALANGLDVRAEDLAPAVGRVIHDDFASMFAELLEKVNTATTQFQLAKKENLAAKAENRAFWRLLRKTLVVALGGVGVATVLLIALPGLWRLIALLPLIIACTYVSIGKDD